MSFIIMYNYATLIQSGCRYMICKFWFENDTLIQGRYCHLLGIWYVFIVVMLFSFFFLILRMIRYMLIYIWRYSNVFWFYIHVRFNNMMIRNVSISFLLHIKMKNIKDNIYPKEVSAVNTELSLKVKRVMLMIFSIDLV